MVDGGVVEFYDIDAFVQDRSARRSVQNHSITGSAAMFRLLVVLLLVHSALPAAAAEPKGPEANIVFRNATLFDGAGKPGVKGDLHIQGDRIVAVGKVKKIEGAKEIDAAGLVICPGFIDLHTHCDTGSPTLTAKTGRPNKNYVMQGVTTVVTGNCGSGPVDAAEYDIRGSDIALRGFRETCHW